jgi:probable rRNA maturation factor
MDLLIDIQNEQDKFEFTPHMQSLIEDVVSQALKNENCTEDAYVAVTLVDNETIREINNEQRNIDSATDVLSFPVLEFEDGEMIAGVGDYFEDKLILVDIVLSLERAEEQRIDFGHSFDREMGYLICHSVLHLLGYDHENEDEREVMRQKEEETLKSLSLTRDI